MVMYGVNPDRSIDYSRPLYPVAMRIITGHFDDAVKDIKSEFRLGSHTIDKPIKELIPGLYHVTNEETVAEILATGLRPGTKTAAGGRSDVHLSAFGPWDSRNIHGKRPEANVRGKPSVICVDRDAIDDYAMRYAANGIGLCDKVILPEYIDAILTFDERDGS